MDESSAAPECRIIENSAGRANPAEFTFSGEDRECTGQGGSCSSRDNVSRKNVTSTRNALTYLSFEEVWLGTSYCLQGPIPSSVFVDRLGSLPLWRRGRRGGLALSRLTGRRRRSGSLLFFLSLLVIMLVLRGALVSLRRLSLRRCRGRGCCRGALGL
jgi:hypothetical protein